MAFLQKMIQNKWYPPADPKTDFSGKTIIVTGSNAGLGLEASIKFAALGASRLIMGVRNLEKGAAAKETIEGRIKDRNPKCFIEVWQLDMLSYDSIKAFSKRVDSEVERLDAAVLNAGVWMPEFEQSQYGWEQTLQVNVLSTVLLALLLLPKLEAAKTAEHTPVLELVSSGTHYRTTFTDAELRTVTNMLDYFNDPEHFKGQRQYGMSKLLLMYALAGLKDLAYPSTDKTTGSPDVFITSVCPGFCKSDLSRGLQGMMYDAARAMAGVMFMRETEEGARSLVSGVTLGEKGHGRFWQHDEIREPAPLLVGETAEKLQKRVWREIIDALSKDVPETREMARL